MATDKSPTKIFKHFVSFIAHVCGLSSFWVNRSSFCIASAGRCFFLKRQPASAAEDWPAAARHRKENVRVSVAGSFDLFAVISPNETAKFLLLGLSRESPPSISAPSIKNDRGGEC